MQNENKVARLKPSQWMNIGWILFGIVAVQFVLPPIIALYKIVELYTWTFSIYDDRIIEKHGVFSVNHKETNLYRIKGIRFDEPFLMRLVGIGNLYVKSSDPYQPELKIAGVKKGLDVWTLLRNSAQSNRKRLDVKEFDLFSL